MLARVWMERWLARVRETGEGGVDPRELAERCALAFDADVGVLEDPLHWLHALARNIAVPGDLLVIRIRSAGRTYWMVADAEDARTYAPHISQGQALERFERELGRQHADVRTHAEQHTPSAAGELVERLRQHARKVAS